MIHVNNCSGKFPSCYYFIRKVQYQLPFSVNGWRNFSIVSHLIFFEGISLSMYLLKIWYDSLSFHVKTISVSICEK